MQVFIVCAGNLSHESAQEIFEALGTSLTRFIVKPDTLKAKGLSQGDVVVCSPFGDTFFHDIQKLQPNVRVFGPRVASLDPKKWNMLPPVIYGIAPLFMDGMARFTVYLDASDDQEATATARQQLQWMGADLVPEAKQASIIFADPTSQASKSARRAHMNRVFNLEFVAKCWKKYVDSLGISIPNPSEHQTPALAGCFIYISMNGVSKAMGQKLVGFASRVGAQVASMLDEAVTHFICNALDGSSECTRARRFGAIPVTHAWLIDCWRKECWLDESAYRPDTTQRRVAQDPPHTSKAVAFLNASSTTPSSPRDRASTIATDSPASESRKRKHAAATSIVTRGQDCDGEVFGDDDEDDEANDDTLRRKTPKKGSQALTDATDDTASPTMLSKGMRGISAPMLSLKTFTAVSSALKSKSSPELDVKRKNNVMELYTCELNLARTMSVIEELFHVPLKEQKAEPGYLNRIFRWTAKIQELSSAVAAELKAQLDSWCEHPAIISHVFHRERMNEYQTLYKRVVTQNEDSKTALDELMVKNRCIANFVRQQETDRRCERKKLVDMLVEPVQHIMRYSLHLQAIIKHTPDNHPDAEPLREVQECFKNILQDTEQTKQDHDKLVSFQLMLHMIDDCPPELFSARRSCVAIEDVMSCANRKDVLTLILLTDHLVVVRGQQRKIEWRHTLTFGRNRRKEFQFVIAHDLRTTSIHDVMESRTADGAVLDQCICVRYNPDDALRPLSQRSQQQEEKHGAASSSNSSSSSSSSSSTTSSAASSQRESMKKNYDSHAYFRFADESCKQAFLAAARSTLRSLTGRLTAEMQGDEEQCRHVETVEQTSRQRCTFGDDEAATTNVPSRTQAPTSASKALATPTDPKQDLVSRMRARSSTISQFEGRGRTLGGRRFSGTAVQMGGNRGSRFMQGVSFKDCGGSSENTVPAKMQEKPLRSSLGGRFIRHIVKRASKLRHSSYHKRLTHSAQAPQRPHVDGLAPLREQNHGGSSSAASEYRSFKDALRSPKRSTQL